MRKRINPAKVNINKEIEQINQDVNRKRTTINKLVNLTMKQENVDYKKAKQLIKQTSIATLIAIEFGMLNN
jgi:hypothetical protein